MCICIVNCRPSENQKNWANLSSHKGLSYSYSDTLSTPIRSCRSPQIDTDTRIHSNTASCFQSLIYLQDRALECLCECGTVSVIYKYIHSPPPPARYYCYFQYCPGFTPPLHPQFNTSFVQPYQNVRLKKLETSVEL